MLNLARDRRGLHFVPGRAGPIAVFPFALEPAAVQRLTTKARVM